MILAVALLGFAISIYIAVEAIVTLYIALKLGPDAARYRFASVILAALSFLLAGSLIKSMEIFSWNSIGIFACVLALRTVLKLVLNWEKSASVTG